MFNKFLSFTQNKSEFLYENSFFLQNTDKLIFATIIAVFLLSTVMSSDVIGFVALVTTFLTLIKLVTQKGEKCEPTHFELWLLAYFMIVVVSLAGSTLFALSLKGFMKTVTYLGFYVSVVHYLKGHKHHIPHILTAIGLCVSFESVVGFIQNFAHVEEISTWQDVSKLNPEEVMTRVYGTLKPYNPNLLGGYFVAGIPTLFGLVATCLADKKYQLAILPLAGAFMSVVALFLTGCRGAYIGCMVIFLSVFGICAKFFWAKFKKLFTTIVASAFAFATAVMIFVTPIRTRVFSIFSMRQDSSNSFRFNVYHSALQMFRDNWLLGIGVGNKNFREIYGLYMRTGFDALSAYNIYLETAVESGIFALVTFLGFLFVMLKDGIKLILKSDGVKDVIFVSTAVVAILGVMVHGFVDTVFFRPQIQFVFWTMCAIISATVQISKNGQEG